jgi:hypothetical protein
MYNRRTTIDKMKVIDINNKFFKKIKYKDIIVLLVKKELSFLDVCYPVHKIHSLDFIKFQES